MSLVVGSAFVVACEPDRKTVEHPLVPAHGYEATFGGPWLGRRGLFPSYRHSEVSSLSFRVKNASSVPLTLLSAGDPEPGPRLLRLIGVRFKLPPPNLFGRDLYPYERAPTKRTKPLVVPRQHEAAIQFHFRMGEWQFFRPRAKRTYNATTTVRYRSEGKEQSVRLDSVKVTVWAPAVDQCRAARRAARRSSSG
jgi:hypothetical protein